MDIVPFSLMSSVGSTGVRPSIHFEKIYGFSRAVLKDYTFYASVTGSPATVSLEIEGSIDRTNFFTLACHNFSAADIAAEKSMFHIIDKPAMDMRARLTKIEGGTDSKITIIGIGI